MAYKTRRCRSRCGRWWCRFRWLLQSWVNIMFAHDTLCDCDGEWKHFKIHVVIHEKEKQLLPSQSTKRMIRWIERRKQKCIHDEFGVVHTTAQVRLRFRIIKHYMIIWTVECSHFDDHHTRRCTIPRAEATCCSLPFFHLFAFQTFSTRSLFAEWTNSLLTIFRWAWAHNNSGYYYMIHTYYEFADGDALLISAIVSSLLRTKRKKKKVLFPHASPGRGYRHHLNVNKSTIWCVVGISMHFNLVTVGGQWALLTSDHRRSIICVLCACISSINSFGLCFQHPPSHLKCQNIYIFFVSSPESADLSQSDAVCLTQFINEFRRQNATNHIEWWVWRGTQTAYKKCHSISNESSLDLLDEKIFFFFVFAVRINGINGIW